MATKTIWLGPTSFNATAAATGPGPVGNQAAPQKASAWNFPGTATGVVGGSYLLPLDWSSGSSVAVELLWSRPLGGTGTVDWECFMTVLAASDQIDEGAGNPIAPANPPALPAAEALARTSMGNFAPAAGSAGSMVRVTVRRLPVSGGYAGAAWLLGLKLTYTST